MTLHTTAQRLWATAEQGGSKLPHSEGALRAQERSDLCWIRQVIGVVVAGALLMAGHVQAADGGVQLRFSLGAAASQDVPVTVTVSGRVLDKKTSQPIAGARLRGYLALAKHWGPEMFAKCPRQETRSALDGTYKLTFVTPLTMTGPYKGKDTIGVDASAPGYETYPQWVQPDVSPEKTEFTSVDFQLSEGKLIRGIVKNPSGQPVPDALVAIDNNSSGAWGYFNSLGETRTASDGSFQLRCSTDPRVIGRDPWLEVLSEGYGHGYYWDILSKGDMGVLTLPAGATVTGRVVSVDGKPVAGCEVIAAESFPGERLITTRTSPDGQYEFKGLHGRPSIVDFYTRKNKRYMADWGLLQVYARAEGGADLKSAPSYKLMPEDGKTTVAPDLVIGGQASVAGKLLPSKTALGLQGLLVRLDHDWEMMVEADAEGRFAFRSVPEGKHKLTAYLPTNLRGDQGIGHADIEVKRGQKIDNVEIQLETLAEVRVQILDAAGAPLEGITAGATWSKDGSGFWTEGTKSDRNGWAVLYLYPGDTQYVRGMDMGSRSLVAEGFVAVEPKAGETLNNVRITMVAPAKVQARLVTATTTPLAQKPVTCVLEYADGIKRQERAQTDASGLFTISGVTPGAIQIVFRTESPRLEGRLSRLAEVKAGETKDLGDIGLQEPKLYEVRGRLLPSPTFANLEGYKIRLDLEEWKPMIPTDAQGRFVLRDVPAGEHRITAYLPYNERTDRGVGHVVVQVKDASLADVSLQLETLATIHVRIQDDKGQPLEGISAAAWWTPDHSGVFTEGTKSGKDGKAVLYLYPDEPQYAGAHDWSNAYKLKSDQQVNLKPSETIPELVVTMTKAQ